MRSAVDALRVSSHVPTQWKAIERKEDNRAVSSVARSGARRSATVVHGTGEEMLSLWLASPCNVCKHQESGDLYRHDVVT